MNLSYSIIIPHHNIPHLLRRCLSSIPRRDDLQIIVVDDMSDFKYRTEMDNLKKQFDYVEFYSTDINLFGGHARNVGLSKAKGKFVFFADADDFFNYCIGDILDDYKDSCFDVIYFNANCCDSNTYKPATRSFHLIQYIDLWNKNRSLSENHLRYMFGEPWAKIIRKKVIIDNEIKFDEIRIHNDTTFSYLVGFFAHDVTVDERYLYCYTTREGSVSVQSDIDRFPIKIDVFGRSSLFFKKHNINVYEDRHYLSLYRLLRLKERDKFIDGVNQLKELGFDLNVIFKEYSHFVCKNSILSAIWSIFYSPYFILKLKCLLGIFSISIIRFIKYKILCLNNQELKRY